MRFVSSGISAVLAIAAAVSAATVPLPARAAESYDNCTGFIDSLPATISSQGTWCLRHDLSTNIIDGNAIIIATNNVTIDCNDFKVGGLAAGAGTTSVGIYAFNRLNLTVRHCNIRGFWYGLIAYGGGHLIEDNGFDANTYAALYVDAAGSTIRSNRVIDTGGSTSFAGFAFGIYAASGVDVLDNTVNGVAPIPNGSGNAMATGIYTESNGEGSVAGNRVRGLAASGTGTTIGIDNSNSGRLVVRDNDVQGNGVAGSIGVYCDNQAMARDNVVAGFATGVQNCLPSGNTVNAN